MCFIFKISLGKSCFIFRYSSRKCLRTWSHSLKITMGSSVPVWNWCGYCNQHTHRAEGWPQRTFHQDCVNQPNWDVCFWLWCLLLISPLQLQHKQNSLFLHKLMWLCFLFNITLIRLVPVCNPLISSVVPAPWTFHKAFFYPTFIWIWGLFSNLIKIHVAPLGSPLKLMAYPY